jgi:hypothetical protein
MCFSQPSLSALGITAGVLLTIGTVSTASGQQGLPQVINDTDYTLALPFYTGMPDFVIGLDDAGDLITTTFIYRPGDKVVTLFQGPDGSTAHIIAANSQGEVLGALDAPHTAPEHNGIPSLEEWERSEFLYDIHDKTYRPINLMRKGGPSNQLIQVVAFNNAHQFVTKDGYGTLELGPVGSSDPPAAETGVTPVHCPGSQADLLTGINNAGQIIGTCQVFDQASKRENRIGYVYNIATGKLDQIGTMSGGMAWPRSINDSGVILGGMGAYGLILKGSRLERLGSAGCTTFAISNHGDILGHCGPRLTISTQAGSAEPLVAKVFSGKYPGIDAAKDRALKVRMDRNPDLSKQRKPPLLDPNFPHPSGSVKLHGRYPMIGWIYYASKRAPDLACCYGGSAPSGGNIEQFGVANYLGFNSEGSWFESEGALYVWNAAKQSLIAPLYGPPAPLRLPDYPQAAATPPVQPNNPTPPAAPAAGTTPYADHPLITKEADGTFTLSYVLKNMGSMDGPRTYKVVRPRAEAVPFGIGMPELGPGNYGSWLWIGDGKDSGIAAMFHFDPSGVLTWAFLSPQVAASYLPSNQKN